MAGTSVFPLCLFCVAVWSAAVINVDAQTRAQYGEPCNKTNDCDLQASLDCNNGFCECLMSGVMIHDGNNCTISAGEKCNFTAVGNQSLEDDSSSREESLCVENAACLEGICTCLPEFYEATNKTCLLKRGFQENCEFDLACKNEHLLKCNEGKKCGCNSTVSIFDQTQMVCVTKAGKFCGNGGLCVLNAACDLETCTCDYGYFPNSLGECEKKRGYNEPCESNSNCLFGTGPQDPQLTCNFDGICDCIYYYSMYHPTKKICVTLAGEICSVFQNCVDNSVCIQTGNYNKVCVCNSDYFKNSDGICEIKRNHGYECESDYNCKKGFKCNLSGICHCDRDVLQIYDQMKQKCVGLAGAYCQESEECVVNSDCYDEISNVTCGRWFDCFKPSCTCRKGFSPTKKGTCLVSHGGSCGIALQRVYNVDEGTICKEGKYVCKYGELQTFHPSEEMCFSNALGPCDDDIQCVANAHCSEQEEYYKHCVCDKGFISADGQCFLGIGQQCDTLSNNISVGHYNYAGQTCDKAAPLSCIEGMCQCEYLEQYDITERKCIGLVGSLCESYDEDFCTPNAGCVGIRTSKQNGNKLGICKCKQGWVSTKTRRCVPKMENR